MCTRVALRSPAASPPPSTRLPVSAVRILHPAYPDANNELLALPAVDVDSSGSVCGVHLGTVHVICTVIADNESAGWLAYDVAGQERVTLDDHDILPAGAYFFYIPPLSTSPIDIIDDVDALRPRVTEAAWPVVPTFRHWRFPLHLPASFAALTVEDRTTVLHPPSLSAISVVRERDKRCLLTGAAEGWERAHIIPSAERDWFRHNMMARYAPTHHADPDRAIDGQHNSFALRADLHVLFDGTTWGRRAFSFVPKPTLATHVNAHSYPETHRAFHNRPLRTLRGVAREYFFARFAYDIFPLLRPFLSAGVPRRLIVRTEAGSHAAQNFDGAACAALGAEQGAGRSISPKKRKSESPIKGVNSVNQTQSKRTLSMGSWSFDSGIAGVARHLKNETENDEGTNTDEASEEEEEEGIAANALLARKRRLEDEFKSEADAEASTWQCRQHRLLQEEGKIGERGRKRWRA